MPSFPTTRLRRPRAHDWSRRIVRETRLVPDDLVWTLIVTDGEDEPVVSMPGVTRMSVTSVAAAAREAYGLGIPAVALFPHIDPARKDAEGAEALNRDGLIPRAIRAIKDAAPELGVMCDVALDPFTTHGHDGVVKDGRVLNDETVAVLCQQALVQAEAGCDVIAPSDMMDGRVGAIRAALDQAGHHDAMILSYAAKYASGFYGPYRDAIGSAQALVGDKKTYQMDPGNAAEAVREAVMDVEEGADMIMVKPGLPYLDIVAKLKAELALPTLVFQVSGEYAMIRAAGANGWIDGDRVMLESLASFKRAGADGILTYFAREAAQALQN